MNPKNTARQGAVLKNIHKGNDFIKVLHSIKKISNFFQVEPTRRLIDLFGKKTGDLALKQELLNHLYEKAVTFDQSEYAA